MAKMKKCKTCGADIAKSAKACPSCGAKNKKSVLLPIVGALVVVGVIGSMGDSNDPKKVGDVSATGSAQEAVSTPAEAEKTVFGVGEIVELNGVSATLLSVSESNGQQYFRPTDGHTFVVCEFEIENKTTGDVAVSSLMSFEAYFDDYSANLDLTATAMSGKEQLDGAIAAGKKMKGVVGYQAPADWSTVELHFSPDVWIGKDIIFTYSK